MTTFTLNAERETSSTGNSLILQLIELLRDPSRWPEGFHWNYDNLDKCAIGLAHATGLIENQNYNVVADTLGMPRHIAMRFFWNLCDDIHVDCSRIQPSHVADALEKYLAGYIRKGLTD